MEHIREDLEISKENLDLELSLQPSLFYKYSEIYSDASERRDVAKIETEQLKSITYSSIKRNSISMGVKMTEKALEEAVNNDADFVEQKLKYVEACKDFNTMCNIMEALKQKQKSISKLCDLFLAGYYTNDSHKKTDAENVISRPDLINEKSVSKKVSPVRKRVA